MTYDQVWEAAKNSLFEIFPEYSTRDIGPEESLKDLGANSIDRAEIIMSTMAHLKLKVPLIEFAQAKNIGELVNIFYSHTQKTVSR